MPKIDSSLKNYFQALGHYIEVKNQSVTIIKAGLKKGDQQYRVVSKIAAFFLAFVYLFKNANFSVNPNKVYNSLVNSLDHDLLYSSANGSSEKLVLFRTNMHLSPETEPLEDPTEFGLTFDATDKETEETYPHVPLSNRREETWSSQLPKSSD
jgi:hypothetical protein